MRKSIFAYAGCLLALLVLVALPSCKSDKKEIEAGPDAQYVAKAKTLLSGDIVFSARTFMAGTDMTRLEQGCPTIFNFKWNGDASMTVSLLDFSVGGMPLTIDFRCKTNPMALSSWEEASHSGKGWLKFYGEDGNVSAGGSDDSDVRQGSGATFTGYVNVLSEEIEFVINYNMMSVRTEVALQPVDPRRLANFQQEMEQYLKDLEEWRQTHGGK